MKTYNGAIVQVIGVGGAGCNTVNYISQQQLQQVNLIACNSDMESLDRSPVEDKLYLELEGEANYSEHGYPEAGRKAVLNQEELIKAKLLKENCEIVFIVAGLGGATGTGAAPEIARIAKELGLLTIGVVTMPFSFEGERKQTIAEVGIAAMRENTDTTIVLANDKLRQVYGNLPTGDAFRKVDDYIANAVRAISEIVTVRAEVNVDVEDVRAVLEGAGPAVVGTAVTVGQGRALLAAEQATDFSLLTKTDMAGAGRILLSIVSGVTAELDMEELTEIVEYIQDKAGEQAEVIFGHAIDDELQDSIRVTLIASCFSDN